MNIPACDVRGVRKHFNCRMALDAFSVVVQPGEIYALLGLNGAGKSTALRVIAGIIEPDVGSVLVCGIDLKQMPTHAKQNLAFVPDEPAMYGKLTPLEFLAFVGALWGGRGGALKVRSEALLRKLDLWERRGDYIESFSRGMKQKLAIAAAFVHNPRLVLLDEPFTALDVKSAESVRDLLISWVAEGGAIILATHLLPIVECIARRVGVVDKGSIIFESTPFEIRAHVDATESEKFDHVVVSALKQHMRESR